MRTFTAEEIRFFDGHPGALALYAAFLDRLEEAVGSVRVDPRKTQISLFRRYMLGCVSLLPVRPKAARPREYITVTLGLPRRLSSPRVDAAAEAAPGRFTHHILIADASEIDDELMAWVREAAAFADRGQG